jgi:anaerobic magnesium-protoporphyrin IX monomethyl ester cyclase
MEKVTLINPPQQNSLDDYLDPPLGLMYLAASLENQNLPVKIVDLASKPESMWPELIGESDVFGITIFSSSFNVSRKIARIIKENNKNSLVVAGGPHPTSLPEDTILNREFDAVVCGEGEEVFPTLVHDYRNGRKVPKIIRSNGILDINALQVPARHLLSLSEYHRQVEGKTATSALSSRGCPYSCSFCCKDIHGAKIRFRDPEKFLEEVGDIKAKYSIRSFLFYDDVFTFNKNGRLDRICEGLKEMDIAFRCNGRAGVNCLDDFIKLKEAGCEEIAFGIESGSQEILNRINKNSTVQQNHQAIQDAKRAGLITKAYLMTGFPGETSQTIDETKAFIESADPDKFTIFSFVPLPGCDVWKNPAKYGITHLSRDWDQYFNIAGNYEGGRTFETDSLSRERAVELHDDLVRFSLKRGQRGSLEKYYKDVKK